jgi:pilus assembly protein CpaB
MNRRALVYILLSIACGVIAVMVFRSQPATPPPVSAGPIGPTTVSVVLAGADIAPGIPIASDDLRIVEWPESFIPPDSFASEDGLVDRVAQRPIREGEPILSSALLGIGEPGGFQALIEPNYRAMSVEVNAVVGVSGFIQPGSRVDVLAQLRTMDGKDGMRMRPHTRTILQNVKVLAIDQQYSGVNAIEAALASVVTLQVLPEEAQRLAFAAAEGKLQLALRGRQDEEVLALRNTMPEDFLDPAPPKPKRVRRKSRPRPSIESMRGTEMGRDYL